MLASETPERVLSCGASLRSTATCDQTVWASQRGRKDRACPEFESGNKGTAVRNDRFLCVETVQARLSPERRLHHLIAGKALKVFKKYGPKGNILITVSDSQTALKQHSNEFKAVPIHFFRMVFCPCHCFPNFSKRSTHLIKD